MFRVALLLAVPLSVASCKGVEDRTAEPNRTQQSSEPWIHGYLKVESSLKGSIGSKLQMESLETFVTDAGAEHRVTWSDSHVREGRTIGTLERFMVDRIPAEVIGDVSPGGIRITRLRYLEDTPDPATNQVRESGQTLLGVVYGLVGSRRRGGVQQALLLWDGKEHYELEILPGAVLAGSDGARASVFARLGHRVFRATGVVQAFKGGPVLRTAELRFVREATNADRDGSPGVSGKYSTDRTP
jgi:hypothetical protein